MKYTDKVVLVTGAANGIGRASAFKFAEEGAAGLILADIDGDHGQTVAEQIAEKHGCEVFFVRGDVSNEAHNKDLVDLAKSKFGRLDIAFNNAGIEGDTATLADYSVETFDKLISINLRGVFLGMKYQIPKMVEQGGGVILNMASVAGLKGFPTLAPYSASKHAVIGLSKSASLEYAEQNIRINVVCPGAIDTPMIHRIAHDDPEQESAYKALQPMGRFGTPEEIADFAAWICSDDAAFVTGACVPVDGGIMAG